MNGIVRIFPNEDKLIEWLGDRRLEYESESEYKEWINIFFLSGNQIQVDGKSYTPELCMKLL